MKTYNYDKALLSAVKARIPSEVNPVFIIMDVLSIGKEAAYRRLRGEVSFSLKEAALLANELDFSLSEVANTSPDKRFNYSIHLVDFETPSPKDYKILEAYVDDVRQGSNDPFSQLAITSNRFPQQLYLRYKNITRFALFKWIYESGLREAKAYHEVIVEERMQEIFRASREAHMQIRNAYYVFDRQLCWALTHELKYFVSIKLLRECDAKIILGEVHKLLDYMEQLSITGKYENGNDVYMYVSNTQFDKAFYNLKVGQYHLSVIQACVLNGLACTEKSCYYEMNSWIHSRRRISTLISCSGEPERIVFFKDLHQQLDEF
ncbi:MAG: hypothetical protein LBS20_17315 [Prevotella sp.]|jgi:hypothetical protein|nr:hypothetical protein [Prevotella sp.]